MTGDCDHDSVTTRVTGWTLKQNVLASLRHYRDRLLELAKSLSITERALPVPETFREELTRSLDASEDGETIRMRNPGEPYRQFLTLVLRKLDANVGRRQGGYRPRSNDCAPRSARPRQREDLGSARRH